MNNEPSPFMYLATVLVAAAAGGLAWVVATIATVPREVSAEGGRFDWARRELIRKGSWIFRTFEPWIDELAIGIQSRNKNLPKIGRDLVTVASPLPYRAAEFVACAYIKAIIIGVTLL